MSIIAKVPQTAGHPTPVSATFNGIANIFNPWVSIRCISKPDILPIKGLKSINDRRPNSFVLRTFFDAKVDEIKSIFSSGPQVNTATLKEDLDRMAPTRRTAWGEIN